VIRRLKAMRANNRPSAPLTLFALPKAFRGHIEIIQRNAITSWTRLQPNPEIILFGDDPGTAEVAREFGLRHIPEVERNSAGTPMVHDLFAKAEEAAHSDLLCYVNSDIILMDDFPTAVGRVSGCSPPLMMVGRRWEVDLGEPWDFARPDWQQCLRSYVQREGRQQSTAFIDYFVFSRGLGRNLLPLAIGRMRWDNWLVWHARSQKATVIDASSVVMAVHQNHDYGHHPGGTQGVRYGEEARRNRDLIGDWYRLLTVEDATHKLTPSALKRSYLHAWLTIKRAWSHPAGMARLIARTVARPFRRQPAQRFS